ncbi:MAG: glycosyltransferase family 2 protein [Bacteroidetes bacterium]|nr:glycosyltransferase family 2 protein [Bacteroidota bacterium]
MEYIVIIPAYNEEKYLSRMLDSLVQQNVLPKKLVIVDDGSTDATPQIIEQFTDKYSWIESICISKDEGYSSGGKIVKAFYSGLNTIAESYDILAKLDADLELPKNYFEEIISLFQSDDKIGIAGGTIVFQKKGEWMYENFSDQDHIKGAFKAYRRTCFEDIKGLRYSIGWDTADELLARYYGWKIAVNPALKIKHHRPLGTETGSVKIRKRVGKGMYRLRYGFWITLISAIKAGFLNRPYLLTGLAVMYGWFSSLFTRDEFIVTKEEGTFIRKFRLQRMLGKLF